MNIIPTDDVEIFVSDKNGLFGLRQKSTGQQLIVPMYDEIIRMGDRFVVKSDNWWGIISPTFDHLEVLRFDEIILLAPTFYKMRKGDLYGLYSLTERTLVLRPEYTEICLRDGYIEATRKISLDLFD